MQLVLLPELFGKTFTSSFNFEKMQSFPSRNKLQKPTFAYLDEESPTGKVGPGSGHFDKFDSLVALGTL